MSRKINRLVAEHIMSLHVCKSEYMDDCYYIDAGPDLAQEIPEYSTDIAAAWEVLNSQFKDKYYEIIHTDGDNMFGFIMDGKAFVEPQEELPLLICLAALKAKGMEVPGE